MVWGRKKRDEVGSQKRGRGKVNRLWEKKKRGAPRSYLLLGREGRGVASSLIKKRGRGACTWWGAGTHEKRKEKPVIWGKTMDFGGVGARVKKGRRAL